MNSAHATVKHLYGAVLVAALGYFVDVFDLWLFANFRVSSLRDLGLTTEEITAQGAFILNSQQAGLLLGGFLWGILGDKYGRSRVLFGSILIYSLGNLANAFATSVTSYAVLRFITGLGLAGEIGAGITLVAELMPKAQRGYGTTIVATVGVSGAIAAAAVGTLLEWRTGFILGGTLGLLLLFLRAYVHESGLFKELASDPEVSRGSLWLLIARRERLLRCISCIGLGVPIWVVFGLYGVFASEIGGALNLGTAVAVPTTLLCASVGMTIGDLLSGLLSQRWQSRKKPITLFMSCSFLSVVALHSGIVRSAEHYYVLMAVAGFFVGFWICALTTAAEQFGTNLRATVTTVIPNVVRATTIPISIAFLSLKGSLGIAPSALAVSTVCFLLAALALASLKESFSRDLNFLEE